MWRRSFHIDDPGSGTGQEVSIGNAFEKVKKCPKNGSGFADSAFPTLQVCLHNGMRGLVNNLSGVKARIVIIHPPRLAI